MIRKKNKMVVHIVEPKWLEWAKQLQAIAQTGLTYASDPFDIERYELIRKISVDIMNQYTKVEPQTIVDLFANETGYATPKVDVRAVVIKNDKILLVREKSDGAWSPPGGWADIGLTPGEVAVKEVKEEAGLDVKATRLLAVFDKKKHPHPPSPYHVYKIFIQCEIEGGNLATGVETSDVRFFAEEHLPPLSRTRITKSQLQIVFQMIKNPAQPVYFD